MKTFRTKGFRTRWLGPLVVAVIAAAPAAAAEGARAALEELLGGIRTLTASFEQRVADGRGIVLETQTGTVGLAKPGRFRWEVVTPFPQLVVAEAGTLYLYDPDLEQLTVQPVDDATGPNPALLLTETNDRVLERFEILADASGQAAGQRFILMPRDEEALFAEIRLSFAEGSLVAIEIRDHLEQITEIAFGNVAVNPVLESGYFEVDVPEGTDVIGDVPDRDTAG